MVTRRSFLGQIGSTLSTAVLAGPGRDVCEDDESSKHAQRPQICRQDYLHRPHCNLYYEVTGSGPAVIFAHGLSGSHLSWWQQIASLSDKYTCITFDHRGFASSIESSDGPGPAAFVDDLTALIDHLQLRDVVLVGQSMGTITCLGCALRDVKRVRGLVLGSTIGGMDIRSIRHPELAKVKAWSERAAKTRGVLTSHAINVAAGARMAREQPALHFLYQEIETFTAESVRERARSVKWPIVPTIHEVVQTQLPILMIAGKEDVVFPPGAFTAVASAIPTSKLELVPKAGHSVYFERPRVYNQVLRSFLETVYPRAVADR